MHRIAICDDDPKYVDYLESIIKMDSNFSENFLIMKYFSGEEF